MSRESINGDAKAGLSSNADAEPGSSGGLDQGAPGSGSASFGIACSLVAWFTFSIGDVGIKYLSGSLPLHQIVLIRSLTAMVITLCVLMPLEGGYKNLRTKHLQLHLLRGGCVVIANLTFFIGLASLSLPEATAIFFVAPVMITVLSFLILKEEVGKYRWFAVLLGLIGVLIMLRPGSTSFRLAGLLPLFAAFAYANLNILTRKIGIRDKASTMAFYIQLVFITVCSLFGLLFGDGRYADPGNPSIDFLFRAWVVPSGRDLAIMMVIGVSSAFGGYFISQAYRLTHAVIIAPFEYVALVLSIFWSVLIWGVWPDLVAWIGILLIFFSGLLIVWREVLIGKKIATRNPFRKPR
ncbi:MAG: DMT family transporter [Granulosicoccus sp.]|nr:DMT family transporter [Granulosicoccus sp.]